MLLSLGYLRTSFIEELHILLLSMLLLCIAVHPYSSNLRLSVRSRNIQRIELTILKSRQYNNKHSEPYRLGLYPHVPKVSNTTTPPSSVELAVSLDEDASTELVSNLSEQKVSYPHLLLLPDLDATKKRLQRPLDEWMLQLPTKWASFIWEGYNSSSNMLPTATIRIYNETEHRDVDTNGIGAFETSEALDAMLEAVLKNESVIVKNILQSTVALSDVPRPHLETKRLSTQPLSIFSVELRKNTSVASSTSNKALPKSNLVKSISSRANPPPYPPPFLGKDPNDLVTIADLETILRNRDFYRSSEPPGFMPDRVDAHFKRATPPQPSSKGGVAFPQPRVLSNRSIKWGATVSAGAMGMLLAISAAQNFWLIGALLGGFSGYEIGQSLSAEDQTSISRNVLQSLVLYTGRHLAKTFLKVLDAFQAFFFMYKTGQLSYEYYKRYAALDNRFGIQSKVDAWNARFVEGKLAFDRWERENEVGRKILAGLRTAWLVEERSQKKRTGLFKRSQRHQSRYRIIQFLYDAAYTSGKLCMSLWSAMLGGEIGLEIRAFFRGLFRGEGLSSTQARIRGIVLTVLLVNLTGALFTISPAVLAIMAAGLGWIWPTWTSEVVERTSRFFEETRARGKGENLPLYASSKMKHSNLKQPSPRYDKTRYHFYLTLDGKRRYYRVGQPWIITHTFQQKPPPKPKGIFSWISRSR